MGSAEQLSSGQVRVLAIAIALAIAALYYSQPILPLVSQAFGVSDAAASHLVMLGQLGYALGLFLFVPIGDRIDRRKLILGLLTVNTMGVAACAIAPSFFFLSVA